MRKLFLLGFFVILSGCASVSFRQLEADSLAPRANAPEGAVYYLPRPYLLVARAPGTTAGTVQPAQPAEIASPHSASNTRAGGRGGAPLPLNYAELPIAQGGAASETPAAAAAPSLGATDTSFGLLVGNYIIKLVYLPDRSRPMSMSVRSGLFGVGSLKPTLQNGWMLTSFDASVDNSHASDVLSSIAEIMNTGLLAGGGAAASTSAAGGGRGARAPSPDREVLRPGLYDFDYDADTGRLTRLCAVSYFTDRGVVHGDCRR